MALVGGIIIVVIVVVMGGMTGNDGHRGESLVVVVEEERDCGDRERAGDGGVSFCSPLPSYNPPVDD